MLDTLIYIGHYTILICAILLMVSGTTGLIVFLVLEAFKMFKGQ